MKQKIKKIIFYITFCVLGVFWAEVISTNLPYGLINPILILVYGLVYIFFIDEIMRRRERNFYILYLLGALVGLITETYVAKVTFYSPDPGADRVLGVAPGAIMFIILFYHAYFSFLLPLYFAGRILNMPFSITQKKWIDIIYIFIPFIILPVVYIQLVMRGLSVIKLISFISISAAVLIFWILLLRFIGDIENVLLSKKEKISLFIFTLIMYSLFLFKCTNKGHGHSPTDFPLIPMLVVSAVILLLLTAIFVKMKRKGKEEEKVPYSPHNINFTLFFLWLFWHIFITGSILTLQKFFTFLPSLVPILGIFGVILGVSSFIYSTAVLIKSLIKN